MSKDAEMLLNILDSLKYNYLKVGCKKIHNMEVFNLVHNNILEFLKI